MHQRTHRQHNYTIQSSDQGGFGVAVARTYGPADPT
jgi:hypothetical protein